MITLSRVTMDDAHTFAQGLIANGWLNQDPDCVDSLFRQLVDITKLPAGYELAISAATPEMEQAGRATGVNAAWSYAKCYRNMLDAQPLAVAISPEVLQAWLTRDICTCSSGDGSLRWPCPMHSPTTAAKPPRAAAADQGDFDCKALRKAIDECEAATAAVPAATELPKE